MVHKFIHNKGAAAPLLVLVHGRGGTVDSMQMFSVSAADRYNLLFPEAPLNDPDGGKCWWLPGGIGTQKETVASTPARCLEAANLLGDCIKEHIREHRLTPSETIAMGFSQGAGVLSVLMQTEPTLFSRVALLCGFVLEREVRPGLANGPRIFMFHGERDPIVPFEMALRGHSYLLALGADVQLIKEETGHKIGSQGMKALRTFID